MPKTLYSNGCSWTYGNGIERDVDFNSTGAHGADLKIATSKYSWPAVLSEKLSYMNINESAGGGSNKRIVRTTCDFLLNYPKENYKDLLVVIGWTTAERSEIHDTRTNNWLCFNNGQRFSSNYDTGLRYRSMSKEYKDGIDEYQKLHISYVHSDVENLTTYIHQKFMLSKLLENLGIKYIFFNSLPATFGLEPDNYKEQFNKIKTEYMMTEYTYLEYCHQNNIRLSPCQHPMIKGHNVWANVLYEKIASLYKDEL